MTGHADLSHDAARLPPTHGDLLVCVYCAEILIVTSSLAIRPPTPIELRVIADAEPVTMRQLEVVRAKVLLNMPRDG